MEPGSDMALVDGLSEIARSRHLPAFTKRENSMMKDARIKQFFQENQGSLKQAVLVGCTTTPCVRESAIALKKKYPFMIVSVDLRRCGAMLSRKVDLCRDCLQAYLAKPVATLNPSFDTCNHPVKFMSPKERAVKRYESG